MTRPQFPREIEKLLESGADILMEAVPAINEFWQERMSYAT